MDTPCPLSRFQAFPTNEEEDLDEYEDEDGDEDEEEEEEEDKAADSSGLPNALKQSI